MGASIPSGQAVSTTERTSGPWEKWDALMSLQLQHVVLFRRISNLATLSWCGHL